MTALATERAPPRSKPGLQLLTGLGAPAEGQSLALNARFLFISKPRSFCDYVRVKGGEDPKTFSLHYKSDFNIDFQHSLRELGYFWERKGTGKGNHEDPTPKG